MLESGKCTAPSADNKLLVLGGLVGSMLVLCGALLMYDTFMQQFMQ